MATTIHVILGFGLLPFSIYTYGVHVVYCTDLLSLLVYDVYCTVFQLAKDLFKQFLTRQRRSMILNKM